MMDIDEILIRVLLSLFVLEFIVIISIVILK